MLAVGGEAVGALLGLGGGVFLLRIFTRRETPLAGYVERKWWQRGEFDGSGDTGRLIGGHGRRLVGLMRMGFLSSSSTVTAYRPRASSKCATIPAVSFNSGLPTRPNSCTTVPRSQAGDASIASSAGCAAPPTPASECGATSFFLAFFLDDMQRGYGVGERRTVRIRDLRSEIRDPMEYRASQVLSVVLARRRAGAADGGGCPVYPAVPA